VRGKRFGVVVATRALSLVSLRPLAEPNVLKKDDLNGGKPFKTTPPDVEGVVKFLVEERNFNEERIRKVRPLSSRPRKRPLLIF
jgi:hypothetical protein